MRERILLLINTLSGAGNGRRDLAQIIECFSLEGCEVTTYPITHEMNYTIDEILKERAHDFDKVVCYGGDGTLNYLVNSLMRNDIHMPIGYIPGGSTNDFSKCFDETKTIEEKCKAIAHGELFSYDLGHFNHKQYFNYVAAFGAFTDTSYKTNTAAKNVLGYGAYALSALANLAETFSFRIGMRIEHDGVIEEGSFIYGGISNSLSVGGMKLPYFKDTSLDDGYFEVLLVRAPDNVVDVANILNDLSQGIMDEKYVYSFKAKHILIEAEDNITWTLDGEYGGSSRKTEIEVIPKAIPICIQAKTER
ncbi:MAG: diacylglycerol kinase family lipid kinase [Solobacterium sp.]|nr:diacylglycerol kinase family lipid kinase [Solobacterium sp.]